MKNDGTYKVDSSSAKRVHDTFTFLFLIFFFFNSITEMRRKNSHFV